MTYKMFRIALAIVSCQLCAQFRCLGGGRRCSNASSLSGTYGFLHDGTDGNGTPATAAVTQVTFDPTTGTFTGETSQHPMAA